MRARQAKPLLLILSIQAYLKLFSSKDDHLELRGSGITHSGKTDKRLRSKNMIASCMYKVSVF